MSVLATPLPLHPSFSDSELFHHPPPTFAHSQTAPYPMPQPQSFSALGAAPQSQPPSAPRPTHQALPDTTEIYQPSPQTTLPPTPDPSPPNSKILFPTTMVKLAPPADDDVEGIPRRLPAISIETDEDPRIVTQAQLAGTSSRPSTITKMEPPVARPIRRSTTAISSVRMAESRSADARARLRSGPRHGSVQLNSPNSPNITRPHSPSMTRAFSDAAVTPPRAHSSVISHSASTAPGTPPDLGGPDGLEAKVVLLGSQGVGKTSLILRYTTRIFSQTPSAATIGTSLYTRKLVHSGTRVKLQIWDTAGQERFRSMAPIYYRGAHVCVLVYDISDRDSFEDVRSWLEELGRTVPKETVIFVVGAKIDLERKRAVSLDEARITIRSWIAPPPPAVPTLLSPPPARSLFRSPSAISKPDTLVDSSSPPSRTPSHMNVAQPTATRPASIKKPASRAIPFPALTITSPTSPSLLTFPTLQSPSKPTFATNTEPVSPSITPAFPASRHGVSAGRFSFSGVLGYNRIHSQSISGVASNLARMAERTADGEPAAALAPPVARVRAESGPGLVGLNLDSGTSFTTRRKSEDWSSRPWRMGEGPSVSEALGEFGDGVKKKQSGELLQSQRGRGRGGSLGRDSRLYGSETPRSSESSHGQGSGEDGDSWGIEVENVRLGECSSLTGDGVEALFRSISSLLVAKKDKIERERIIRHKHSVLLTDPSLIKDAAKGKDGKHWNSNFGCCT
ncbi:hypothetical protein P7C73_g2326, partial [Tremellales sp. Uapishka_1]